MDTRLPLVDDQPNPFSSAPRPPARPLVPVELGPAFRVGETERAAACDALAEHFAAGRLDPAELDDRLTRAMSARSQGDLRVLFRDLRPRRPVPDAPAERPDATGSARSAVSFLTALLILCLLLAGGMLLVLGAYDAGLLVAALVGGTATAVAGGCLTAIGQATLRRR